MPQNAYSRRTLRKQLCVRKDDRLFGEPRQRRFGPAVFYTNGQAGFPPDGYKLDSRYIEDGSFLRLKTVNFAYNLPLKENKLGLTNLKFTLSGQNLFTWTNYTGFDPEVSISGNPLTPNLDFSAYPLNKIYNIGVSAKF